MKRFLKISLLGAVACMGLSNVDAAASPVMECPTADVVHHSFATTFSGLSRMRGGENTVQLNSRNDQLNIQGYGVDRIWGTFQNFRTWENSGDKLKLKKHSNGRNCHYSSSDGKIKIELRKK